MRIVSPRDCGLVIIVALLASASLARDTSSIGTLDVEQTWHSPHLGGELIILPGVFHPIEGEGHVLPLMDENKALFEGKSVLEIGTGSGIISVYAAKLGAIRVVATDINESAIESATRNAEKFGVASVVEPRLVPATDISAYSVIGPDETFDVIISNPPYSLDLEAGRNDAVTDAGDLGFSIVRGLRSHLRPGGVAVLLYNSLFYHLAMVKFARYSGYEVRNHRPYQFTKWEAEAVFNSYLEKLLEREGVDRDAFRFDFTEAHTLQGIKIARATREGQQPLFPGNSKKTYAGMIVIERRKGPAGG